MSNKISIILAGVLISISPILAKVGGISVDELSNKDKFKEFQNINKKVVESFIDSRSKTNKVGKQEILHYNKKAVGRVYHLKPSGYVVATLNKNDVPIKAYSFNGDFNKLPEEYKDFLSARLYEYSQITEKLEKTQKLDTENKNVWDYLENYTEESPKPEIETNIVDSNKKNRTYSVGSALLTTEWGQGVVAEDAGSTYNRFTRPYISSTGSLRTLVGCAPLAWGQIMRFHEWPLAPRATTDEYDWNRENISMPLSLPGIDLTNPNRYGNGDTNNNYDWNNMLNSIEDYHTTQKEAIGKLLADLGYALEADWGLNSTNAFTHGPNDALPKIMQHFGYSMNMSREIYFSTIPENSYPASEIVDYNTFRSSIILDLYNEQPLLLAYSTSGSGGHATVADGFRNVNNAPLANSFEIHINIGWGGTNNDFYTMTERVPWRDDNLVNTTGGADIELLTEIVIVKGIKPCTSSANDCHFNFQ